jgi:hypothetical protein
VTEETSPFARDLGRGDERQGVRHDNVDGRAARGERREGRRVMPAHDPFKPVAIGLLLVLAFIGFFTWAFHDPHPHDVPIAVVAPPGVQQQLRAGLDAHAPGAFDLRTYDTPVQARNAVRARDVDGAFLARRDGATVLVAGGAGVGNAQAVGKAFTAAAAAAGQRAEVRDVAPVSDNDTQGLMPFFFVLALTIPSLVMRIITHVTALSTTDWRGQDNLRREALALALFALTAGLVAAAAFDLLGVLEGAFWELWLTGSVLAAAITGLVAALQRLGGIPAMGLGILLVIFGLASSGGPLDQQFLPDGLRGLAPLQPVGAAIDAVRNAVYFDDARLGAPLLVLAVWALSVAVVYAGRGTWQARTFPGLAHHAEGRAA